MLPRALNVTWNPKGSLMGHRGGGMATLNMGPFFHVAVVIFLQLHSLKGIRCVLSHSLLIFTLSYGILLVHREANYFTIVADSRCTSVDEANCTC